MKELIANEGMMLYNGDVIVKRVATYGDLSAWREITIEEAQKIQEELDNEELIPDEGEY